MAISAENNSGIVSFDLQVNYDENKPEWRIIMKSLLCIFISLGSCDEAVYCTLCSKELCRQTKAVKKLGHDFGPWTVTTEPSCTEKGEETRVCSHDASHKETRYINAKGHNWGEWMVTKEPTAEAEGEETRICKNDSSHKEIRSIDKLPVVNYTISINVTEGGTAEVSESQAESGTKITVTVTPGSGYVLDKITYTTAGGTATDITSEKSFVMPENNVSVNVSFKHKYLTGDVNMDGKVNAKDKAILNRYLAGWAGYDAQILSWNAADIDKSGKVNAKDKAILNRYLAGWTGYDAYFK